MPKYSDIKHAALCHPTIYRGMKAGVSVEAICCILAEQNEMLVARVMELELIAPKRISDQYGRSWIYRCPDEFVPEVRA